MSLNRLLEIMHKLILQMDPTCSSYSLLKSDQRHAKTNCIELPIHTTFKVQSIEVYKHSILVDLGMVSLQSQIATRKVRL